MKLIITLIFCLFLSIGYGQTLTEWFPVGAEWYYSNPSSLDFRQECVKYQVIKDTVWNGNSCKQLKISSCVGDSLVEFAYFLQDSLVIKYLNFSSNQFHTLFDFGKSVGDTVIVHDGKFVPNKVFFTSFDTLIDFKYIIRKKENIAIDGINLQMQTIESIDNSSFNFMNYLGVDTSYNNTIIEKIGPFTNMLGNFYATIPESYFSFLRCYQDNEINFKQPNWTKDCNTITGISSAFVKQEGLNFYPNPHPIGQGIQLNLNENVQVIAVFSISGKRVSFGLTGKMLNIDTVEPGIYFVQFFIENQLYTQKIILQ